MEPTDTAPTAEPFRVRFVPGVSPGRWLRTWRERMPADELDAGLVEQEDQVAVLRTGAAHMCFVRLPVDREGLHVIPLYEEVPVVVVAKDHPVAAFDEVDLADLAGEHLLQDPGDVPQWRDVATEVRDGTRHEVPPMSVKQAVEVVASGAGIVVVPLSLARLHHRKDVVHRPVHHVAPSAVGLAWREDDDDPRIETFIGIVRGRTTRSSRGAQEGAREQDAGASARSADGTERRRPGGGDGRSDGGQGRRRTGAPGRPRAGKGRRSGGRPGRSR